MSNTFKVGVILPSRGLMFSRTADDLIKNLQGYNYKIFFSHRKPIPECFEEPLQRALKDKDITHIWMVEDDMMLHPNTFLELLDADKAVVTADYPITKDGRGSVFKDADGKVIFCGTGCVLIKREVFDELKAPVFHTKTKWNVKNFGDFIKFQSIPNDTDDGYGLHDINFCMELYQKDIPIHVIKRKLGQRKLKALGKVGTNDGAHQIEEWTKVVKNKRLKEIQSYPALDHGNLVVVSTDSGQVSCSKEHADKMVKAGKGKLMPQRATVVEWGE